MRRYGGGGQDPLDVAARRVKNGTRRTMFKVFGLLNELGRSPRRQNVRPASATQQRASQLRSLWLSIQRHCMVEDNEKREALLVADLEEMTTLFDMDELSGDSRKECLTMALEKDMFTWLTSLALGGPSGITKAFIQLMLMLIDRQEDEFLAQEAVCRNLARLFHYLHKRRHKRTVMLNTAELLLRVCQKTDKFKPLLNIWFDRDVWRQRVKVGDEETIVTTYGFNIEPEDEAVAREEEFLLFQLLLGQCHRPDATGRLAKNCIRMLVSAASINPEALLWITCSDLPRLATSGLGGCWSQLHLSPAISDELEDDVVETSTFDQFIQHVAWLEDLMSATTDKRFRDVMVDAYWEGFLMPVLYPAMLSSGAGPSQQSVETSLSAIVHLDALCRTMRNLAGVTLSYLFGQGQSLASSPTKLAHEQAKRKSRRRQSLFISGDRGPDIDPHFFSLLDVLKDNMRQDAPSAVKAATLQLCATLTSCHGMHIEAPLLQSEVVDSRQPGWDGAFDGTAADTTTLESMRVSSEAPAEDVDPAVLIAIRSQPPPLPHFRELSTTRGTEITYRVDIHSAQRKAYPHRLNVLGERCWLLQSCLEHLSRSIIGAGHFGASPGGEGAVQAEFDEVVFVAATALLTALVADRRRSLANWMSSAARKVPIGASRFVPGAIDEEVDGEEDEADTVSLREELAQLQRLLDKDDPNYIDSDDDCSDVAEASIGAQSSIATQADSPASANMAPVAVAVAREDDGPSSVVITTLRRCAEELRTQRFMCTDAHRAIVERKVVLFDGLLSELAAVIRLRQELTAAMLPVELGEEDAVAVREHDELVVWQPLLPTLPS